MIVVMTFMPDFTVSVTDYSRHDVYAGGLYCLHHKCVILVVTCMPDFTVSSQMILVVTNVPDFTVLVTDDSRHDVYAGLYCLRHRRFSS